MYLSAYRTCRTIIFPHLTNYIIVFSHRRCLIPPVPPVPRKSGLIIIIIIIITIINDDDLNVQGCFGWLKEWPSALTHTIAGMMELYEQMLPTRVYTTYKTRANPSDDTLCRLCGKTVESLEHVLAECLALAQSKYLARHNAVLKVLFFEMLRDLQLCEGVPPWYSPVAPNTLYESPDAQAFWDIPMFPEHNHVRSNRVDVRGLPSTPPFGGN